MKEIDEKNILLNKWKHNGLISNKYQKVCKALNYIEHLLNLASNVTGYVSFFLFASLDDVPAGVASSAVRIKTCTITAVIKKYK